MTRPTTPPVQLTPAQALKDFRRKIDAFFADPRATGVVRRVPVPGPPPPTNRAQALRSSLNDIMSRLGADTDADEFHLDRSILMHGGEVVAVTGGSAPMPADDDVRVVTTTTTVLESGRMRVETSVLVFARGRG